MAILKTKDDKGNVSKVLALKGKPGKSAYEYARDDGYTGTEEDFIKALNSITSNEVNSWAMVQHLVRLGVASRIFKVGDQLVCNHETYGELIWDIIGIDHDIPSDQTKKHSLTLQLHNVFIKALYTDIQGMFYAENVLPAGTYNFTIPAGIDDENGGGKTYYFTLTKEVPAGGVIYFPWEANKQALNVKLYTYPNNIDAMIEYTTVQEGTEGTPLESLGELNSFELRNGSNNWFNSAIRQYLNSDAEVGEVWKPTNKYGRPPSWNATTAGFLNGMDEDFLAVVGEVEKITVLSDFDGGGVETYPEKFFLLSTTEVFSWNETEIPEGEVYDFYKENSDHSEPNGGADSNRSKYMLGTETTTDWWLRTPQKDSVENTRCVTSDGRVGRVGVRYSYGICPVCCVV